MMADQQRDADQPPKAERPTAVNGFKSATPRQNDDPTLAGRLALGGAVIRR
jgi:hypothetical protein